MDGSFASGIGSAIVVIIIAAIIIVSCLWIGVGYFVGKSKYERGYLDGQVDYKKGIIKIKIDTSTEYRLK